MLAAIATAARGLAVQSRRIAEVAQAVAGAGTAQAEGGTAGSSGAPVRIGALPFGDPVQSLTTIVDAQLAFRMNAAIIGTAADMADSLLDAVSPHDK